MRKIPSWVFFTSFKFYKNGTKSCKAPQFVEIFRFKIRRLEL